jgi:ABC-type transport system substrate-binding protein
MRTKISKLLIPIICCALFVVSCEQTDKGARSNTLHIRLEAAVEKVNPLLKGPAYARYVANNVFQTLGIFEPATLELQPLLIKSLPTATTVADGPYKGMEEYSFEIRDEAKWDNGTPITAADVVFSYKAVLNPLVNNPFKPYLDLLRGIEVDPANPKKFKVYLATYYFLGTESLCQMPIYPKYNYDPKGLLDNIAIKDLTDKKTSELLAQQDKGLQEHAAFFQGAELNGTPATIRGSGPYEVVFLDKAQGVTLARKKDWWGTGLAANQPYLAAYPDTLHYQLVVAEDAALNLIRSGELDVAGGISPATFKKLETDAQITAGYEMFLQAAPISNRVMFNNLDPILADKKVRKALAHSIDYDQMLNEIQLGMARRTAGPVFPDYASYNKDLTPYTFDPAKAKALLAEAGWSDTDGDGVADKTIGGKKTPLTLELMNTTGQGVSDQVTASLTASMAKSGVKLVLKAVDINKMIEEMVAGKFQLASNAVTLYAGEADFTQTHHSKSLAPKGDNRMRYANPDFDALLDKIRTTRDKNERMALTKQAQAMLYEDVPEVYLYCPGFRIVKSRQFDFVHTANRPGYVEYLSKLKK